MRFGYDTTNKSSIFDDIDSLCGSTSATYPTLSKARNVLQAYQRVATLIWESDGTWGYDDSNATDAPKATRTMGQASATYQIPTTAMRVEGVEIKDAGSKWKKLSPLNYHELGQSPEEFLKTSSEPLYYELTGNEVRLYPPPHSAYATLTSGLCLRISREVSAFTSASTASPGFPSAFHRILSYAAALDFERDESQRKHFLQMKDRLERGLAIFYSKRGAQYKTRIKPIGKRHWRQYE